MGKKKEKRRKPEVEHMLKLHEKVPFGSKVDKKKSICCKKKNTRGQ